MKGFEQNALRTGDSGALDLENSCILPPATETRLAEKEVYEALDADRLAVHNACIRSQ